MTWIIRRLDSVLLISVAFIYVGKLPVLFYASLRKLGISPYQDLKKYLPIIPKPILTRCWVGFWERTLTFSPIIPLRSCYGQCRSSCVGASHLLDCNFLILILSTSFQLCWNWLVVFNRRVRTVFFVLLRVFFGPKEVSGTLLLVPDSQDFVLSVVRSFLVYFGSCSIACSAAGCRLYHWNSSLVVHEYGLEHLLKWPFGIWIVAQLYLCVVSTLRFWHPILFLRHLASVNPFKI